MKKTERHRKVVLSFPYILIFYSFLGSTLHLNLVEKCMYLTINPFFARYQGVFIDKYLMIHPQKCVRYSKHSLNKSAPPDSSRHPSV